MSVNFCAGLQIFDKMQYVFIYIFRYAASVGAKHVHCSAKQNKGIEELFLDLSKSKIFYIYSQPVKCPLIHLPINQPAQSVTQSVD